MDIDYRGEHIDLKKLWNQFLHKLWMVIAATIVGAIIGVLVYVVYSNIVAGNQVYELRNDYYIYLDYEGYPNGPDYYNAYTWDSILRDDPIVDYALEITDGLTKNQILESVTGEILGDYRILTVVVRGTDKNLVQKISDAYKQALPHFATVIDMIDHIDLWTDAEITEYDAYTREGNAAFLGGLIGLLISLFGVLIMVILDTAIYSEHDWNVRYPEIPFMGAKGTDEYAVNLEHILGSEEGYIIQPVDSFEFSSELFNLMRAGNGVLIAIKKGKNSGEKIETVISTLKKQDVKIVGAFFTE